MKGIAEMIENFSFENDMQYGENFYIDQFGIADFTHLGIPRIVKRNRDFLLTVIKAEQELTSLKKASSKEIEKMNSKKLYETYGGLINEYGKILNIYAESSDARMSPAIDVLIYSVTNFSCTNLKPIRKILGVIPASMKLTLMGFGKRYNLSDLILQSNRHNKAYLVKLFPQFIKYLKFNLSNKALTRKINVRYQIVHKSATAIDELINSLFFVYRTLAMVSVNTYVMSSIESIFNDQFISEKIDFLSTDKDRASKVQLTIKEKILERREKLVLETFEYKRVFLKSIKRQYKKELKGYIAKLEYDNATGFYIRWYFFLIPNVQLSYREVADDIGKIWMEEVTQGGLYQNNTSIFNNMALIEGSNVEMLNILKFTVIRLIYCDYFIKHFFYSKKSISMSQRPLKKSRIIQSHIA